MRRFFVTAVVCAMMIGLSLTGCGGGGGGDKSDPTSSPTSTPTSSSTTPTPTPTDSPSANPNTVTRKVRGYLDRIDQLSEAWGLIKVALHIKGKARQATDLTVTPSADGTFEFTAVPLGSYELTVTASDGSVREATVPVTVVQEKAEIAVAEIGLIPAGVEIDHIEIVLPAADGAGGSYIINHDYTFRARVIQKNGAVLDNWQPLWSVTGGVGSISKQGVLRTAPLAAQGKIVAYFNLGSDTVTFSSPTVNVVSNEITPPTLFIAGDAPGSGYGLLWYNARTGSRIDTQLVDGVTSSSQVGSNSDGTVFISGGSGRRTLFARFGDGRLTSGSVANSITAVGVLPSGNPIVFDAFSDAFTTLDKNQITVLTSGQQPKLFTTVYDIQTNPYDGKVYVAGVTSDNMSVVRRFAATDDGTLTADGGPLVQDKTTVHRYTGIAFFESGYMVLHDFYNHALRPFSTSGGPGLGGDVSVPNSYDVGMTTARSVFNQNDEVLYILASDGIHRFRNDGNVLTPLDNNTAFFKTGSYVLDLVSVPAR